MTHAGNDEYRGQQLDEDDAGSSEHRARLIERAMLVQLGAGLTVGDDIVTRLRDLSHRRPSSQGLERRLHRYEQRGRRVEERAIAFGRRITKV